jgi:hypothetical protein
LKSDSNTIFKNAYTWLCTNLTLGSYVKFFNDSANNLIHTYYKSTGTVNVSEFDVKMTVSPDTNQSESTKTGIGKLSYYAKQLFFISTSNYSWIQMYNTFSNNVQFSIKSNESAQNQYPDFLITVKNLLVGDFLKGGVAMFASYINLASYGNFLDQGYLTTELSYVRVFNTGLSNLTGISFKSDNTNTQNTSDSSIICIPTESSQLQPLNNGLGSLLLCSDDIKIGTALSPYNIAGARNIIIGNDNSNTIIYGNVSLRGDLDWLPADGSTINPMVVRQVARRLR